MVITARSVLPLVLLLGLPLPERVGAAPENVPHAGSWALELQLEPISGATKYGLATKFHVSERSAARLGFLMTLDTEDSEDSRREERTDIYGTTTTTSGSESSFDQTSGSVFLHYVRYATVADRFGLSLDAGPVFVWNYSQGMQTATYPPPQGQRVVNYVSDQKSYGFELQAGFEWHFVRRLSLAGRYGISALRDESRRTITDLQSESAQVSDGFTVQTSRSLFSLIAYW